MFKNFLIGWSLYIICQSVLAAEIWTHQLKIKVDPATGTLQLEDRLQIPKKSDSNVFYLSRDFRIIQAKPAIEPIQSASNRHHIAYKRPDKATEIYLKIEAKLRNAKPSGPFFMPRQVMDEKGLYLDAGSTWYPNHPQVLHRFEMAISGPANWQFISQGERKGDKGPMIWQENHPQEGIYLLGGPYQRYSAQQDDVALEVYLLDPDDALARRYLQKSAQYLLETEKLLGQYPYAKFAVVENRWQTGYGMPSFTLLGSRVMRFPFILDSSLPHELVHNWLGNGIFVDYDQGNWCEGLTAYLADHRIQAKKGEGAQYRRRLLENYQNFAAKGADFPLLEFRSRHNEASQSIGYGKSLMLFHMLKQVMGETAFDQALKRVYREKAFSILGFEEFLQAFLQDTNAAEILQTARWLNEKGAPKLKIVAANWVNSANRPGQIHLTLLQSQPEKPYHLQIPLQIHLLQSNEIIEQKVIMYQRQQDFVLSVPQKPKSLAVDGHFDLFRALDATEQSSSFGRLFGAQKQILLLPNDSSPAEQKAWLQLAEVWQKRYRNVEVISDSADFDFNDQDGVWILGWQNRKLEQVRARFFGSGQRLDADKVDLNGKEFTQNAFVSVLLDPDNSRSPLGFIGLQSPESAERLAQKMTHYASFGRAIFETSQLKNKVRDRLPVIRTALMHFFEN